MTDVFISYWSDVIKNPVTAGMHLRKMIKTPTGVFTKTLDKSKWINTEIATGDLSDKITR